MGHRMADNAILSFAPGIEEAREQPGTKLTHFSEN